jgi:hypothetical protein
VENPTSTGSDNNNGQGYSVSGGTLNGLDFTTDPDAIYYIMVVTYDAARADVVNIGGGRPTIGGGYANVYEVIMIGRDGVIGRLDIDFSVKLGGTDQEAAAGYAAEDVKAINWAGLSYWDEVADAAVEPTVTVLKDGGAFANTGFDVTVFAKSGAGFVTIPTGLSFGDYTISLEWELTDGTKYYAETTFTVQNPMAGTLTVDAVVSGTDVIVTASGITTAGVDYALVVRNASGGIVAASSYSVSWSGTVATVSGLNLPGRVYTFEITVSKTDYKSVTVSSKVSVPVQNLQKHTVNPTGNEIYLQWDPVVGFTSSSPSGDDFNKNYYLEYSYSGDPGTWTRLTYGGNDEPRVTSGSGGGVDTRNGTLLITGATGGVTYYFRIISQELYNDGTSDSDREYSNVFSITTTAPTAAPGIPNLGSPALSTVSGTTQVKFVWQHLVGANGAHSYNVRYRVYNSGDEWTTVSLPLDTDPAWRLTVNGGRWASWTSPDLLPDVEYEFQVQAVNTQGAGTWTTSVKITP